MEFTPVYGTSASLRYIERNKLWRAQNQEEDTYTVYCHGIPLSGKTDDVVSHFVLVLEDVHSF